MLSQWTFLERLVLIREGFTTEFKQTRTTKGRQSNQMFRHNLCFNEVAMFPLFYIFMCAFCLSTFMGAILSAQATPYLLVWARYMLFRAAYLLFILCLIYVLQLHMGLQNFLCEWTCNCVQEWFFEMLVQAETHEFWHGISTQHLDQHLLNIISGSSRRSQGSLWPNIDPVSRSLGYRSIGDLNPLFNNISDRDSYAKRQLFCVFYRWDIQLWKFKFLHLNSLI